MPLSFLDIDTFFSNFSFHSFLDRASIWSPEYHSLVLESPLWPPTQPSKCLDSQGKPTLQDVISGCYLFLLLLKNFFRRIRKYISEFWLDWVMFNLEKDLRWEERINEMFWAQLSKGTQSCRMLSLSRKQMMKGCLTSGKISRCLLSSVSISCFLFAEGKPENQILRETELILLRVWKHCPLWQRTGGLRRNHPSWSRRHGTRRYCWPAA